MASKDWRSLGLVGRMFRELRDENRAGAVPGGCRSGGRAGAGLWGRNGGQL